MFTRKSAVVTWGPLDNPVQPFHPIEDLNPRCKVPFMIQESQVLETGLGNRVLH